MVKSVHKVIVGKTCWGAHIGFQLGGLQVDRPAHPLSQYASSSAAQVALTVGGSGGCRARLEGAECTRSLLSSASVGTAGVISHSGQHLELSLC